MFLCLCFPITFFSTSSELRASQFYLSQTFPRKQSPPSESVLYEQSQFLIFGALIQTTVHAGELRTSVEDPPFPAFTQHSKWRYIGHERRTEFNYVLSKNVRKKGGKSEWCIQETEEMYTNFATPQSTKVISYWINSIETILVLDDVGFQKEIMISVSNRISQYYVWLKY
jgi:hypothetical protein